MLSKNKIKIINSLANKKFRDEFGLFVVEGEKIVGELLNSDFEIEEIYCLPEWKQKNPKAKNVVEISEGELKKISSMSAPNKVLALVKIHEYDLDYNELASSLILGLEDVQDPGNMGTIIRTADWFGIKDIICSKKCVDVFNPKTVQSTMGAFCRMRIHYGDLGEFIKKIKSAQKSFSTYGTFMKGENIYEEKLNQNGMILFGNESVGLSKEIEKIVDKKLFIPDYPAGNQSSSLNVAVATAIVCSEFRRRMN